MSIKRGPLIRGFVGIALPIGLVLGSVGIASASTVAVGQFELCAFGNYRADAWLDGSFLTSAAPDTCSLKDPSPLTGPETVAVFVDNANPAIHIVSFRYDVADNGLGVTVAGTSQHPTWSQF